MTITKNVSNYNDISLANQSGLRIRSVFSLHSVVAFLYLFGQFVMLNLFQHPDSETSSQ